MNGKDNRIIEKKRAGYYVVIPKEIDEFFMPLFCPVCDSMFRTVADDLAYNSFKCCAYCAMLWAEPNAEKWATGWRPSVAEIAQAQSNRPKLSFTLT